MDLSNFLKCILESILISGGSFTEAQECKFQTFFRVRKALPEKASLENPPIAKLDDENLEWRDKTQEIMKNSCWRLEEILDVKQ